MAKDVIIACDFPSGEETMAFLDRFQGRARPYVKIGMELFYAQGPDIVKRLKDRGHPVFLDLKLHDIPSTVGRAMEVLSRLGADMINLHAAGGSAMMEAAMEGLSRGGGQRPLLIAVTQLTSTSQERLEKELLIPRPMEEVVTAYARTAKSAGLDGVVCSPLEAGTIHAACGAGFLTVTPGVRFAGAAGDDQQRVTTPARARALGSDYIVVGRPITQAPDPLAAYEKCLREFLTDNTNE
ncbi:MAG: orotidine-5'-phosphate decarboxylase [Oscillospiraceae bacterium]|nr:orotidine-5'-phosphate decarboxylase [Oscillospiraceae bacterium]